MKINSPIFKYKNEPFLWKYNIVNYLKTKDTNNNIQDMKKNNLFKKTIPNPDETVIDIDIIENNESKYIYYPSPMKTPIKTPIKTPMKTPIEDIDTKHYPSNVKEETVNKKVIKEILPEKVVKIDSEVINHEIPVESFSKTEGNEIKNEDFKKNIIEKVEKKSEQKVEMTKDKQLKSLNTNITTEELISTKEDNIIINREENNTVSEEENVYTEGDLLFNLKIISELNTSDKLSCGTKLFKIDDPSYTQGFCRWWYGEDRAKTLEKLNQIIDSTFDYMDKTFTKRVRSPGSSDSIEHVLYETNSQIMQKFYITLMDTIKGLDKLKSTYVTDKSMTTGLTLLIDKIRRRTDKINEILKIVP